MALNPRKNVPWVCHRQNGRMANITTCPLPTGASTTWARPARASPWASVPESSMSAGLFGNAITTRGRESVVAEPELRAPVRRNAARSAFAAPAAPRRGRAGIGVRLPRATAGAGWPSASCSGPGRRCRRRRTPANSRGIPPPPALSTGAWLKYTGTCGVVAVGDRALRVRHDAAHDRAADKQLLRLLDGDAAGDAVLGEDGGGGALDDQRAARPGRTWPARAGPRGPCRPGCRRSDRARRGSGSCRSSGREAAASPVLAMPLTCGGRAAADVREDDHVILRAEVALPELLVGEVGVGHAVGIERGAHPPFVLRPLPAVDVADPRHVEFVLLTAGADATATPDRPRSFSTGSSCAAIGVRDDERPGPEVVTRRHRSRPRRRPS